MAAGNEGSDQRVMFEHDLLHDLNNATGILPEHFNIMKISQGSIIIDLQICTQGSSSGANAQSVAIDLKRQAADPESPLCHGLVTRHLQSMVVVPRSVRHS